MKKIIICLAASLVLLMASCKKEVCYKCRDSDYARVYAKDTDTIIVIGNAAGVGIQNLIDSGYTRAYNTFIWQDNFITICNDEGIKEYHSFNRDSCKQI